MITLRKRFAGSRASRHMLLPAMLFLVVAVTSVAAGEARRLFFGDEPAVVVDAVATAEAVERSGA